MLDLEYKIKYLQSNNIYSKLEYLNNISSTKILEELYLQTHNIFLKKQIIRIAKTPTIYNLGLREKNESIRIEVIRCIHLDLKAKWALEEDKEKEVIKEPKKKSISKCNQTILTYKNPIPLAPESKPSVVKESIVEPENIEEIQVENKQEYIEQKEIEIIPPVDTISTAVESVIEKPISDNNIPDKIEEIDKKLEKKTSTTKQKTVIDFKPKVIRRPRNESIKVTNPKDDVTEILDRQRIANIWDLNLLLKLKNTHDSTEDIDKQIDIVTYNDSLLKALEQR